MHAVAASKPFPTTSLVRKNNTRRLIASRYSKSGDSVLTRIADSKKHLDDIFDLDNATNDRLLAESDMLAGIGIHELVFGVPYYRIVNATFTHPHPLGSRFNGPDRGAWYAGFDVKTAQAEVAYDKTLDLLEIGILSDDATYDEYLADFAAEFHDLRDATRFVKYLDSRSYVASQKLAEELLALGSLGIIYPNVRHRSGMCVACFRPALVMNVRKNSTYRFVWNGAPTPVITLVS